VTLRRRAHQAVASVAVIVVLTGCGGTGTSSTSRTQQAGPRTTYVAVGGSDAVGYGTDDPLLDAWPQQFFRRSLPLDTVFVNAAVPGATVAAAITDQAPLATSSHATVVTVWLVSPDLLDGTPATLYGTELLRLLTTLRNGGRTTVLVGNVPPLAQLPGYPACRDGATVVRRGFRCPVDLPDPGTLTAASAAYDQVIAADAARSGAILVDVQRAVASSVVHGGAPFLDPSGTDLSTAGSTLFAQIFSAALPAGDHHTA
jgi:hypothetical protein